MAKSVQITGSVLDWAIRQSGYGGDEFALKLGVESEVVASWINEAELPTRGELTKLAKALKRPSAFFFLPKPPQRGRLDPDFRMVKGQKPRSLSPLEMREYRRARRVQGLLSWILRKEGAPKPRLVSLRPMEPVRPAAARIRDWLGVPPSQQLSWPKRRYSVAFANWRKILIDKRIQVFVQALGREGIRGFSRFDDYAPLIVVNSAEIHAARNFTLFHELAHLMTRTDSACGSVSVVSGKGPRLERWCEEIAAAVLMPEEAFAEVARIIRKSPNPPQDEFALAVRIAGYFNVSIRSAGIRLSSMGLASRSLYAEIEAKAIPLDRKKAGRGSGGGERAPERRLRELGEAVTGRLLDAQASNWVTERDLRSILRLDGAEIELLRGVV